MNQYTYKDYRNGENIVTVLYTENILEADKLLLKNLQINATMVSCNIKFRKQCPHCEGCGLENQEEHCHVCDGYGVVYVDNLL